MPDGTVPNEMVVPRFPGAGEIDVVEKRVPNPEAGQLLIRVKANAVCGAERGQFFAGSEVTPGHPPVSHFL
jgi:threonine 3-dehydrogenase